MSFAAHYIRSETCFIDVGANVGTYSILAATRGALVCAFEPITDAFEALQDNIALNRFESNIVAFNIGITARTETRQFTNHKGPENRAIVLNGNKQPGVSIPCKPLDEAVEIAHILKIDVEGLETEVLKGPASISPRKCSEVRVYPGICRALADHSPVSIAQGSAQCLL